MERDGVRRAGSGAGDVDAGVRRARARDRAADVYTGVVSWGERVRNVPEPGKDLPPVGTILSQSSPSKGGGADRGGTATSNGARSVSNGDGRAPEQSLLNDSRFRAAEQLVGSLTEEQRATLQRILAQNESRIAATASGLPSASNQLPAADKGSASTSNAPKPG